MLGVVIVVILLIVLTAPLLFGLALAAGIIYSAGGKLGSSEQGHRITWKDEIVDENHGIETALSMFCVEIEPHEYNTVSPEEFDSMNVCNHRAKLGATLDEIFPVEDRPRGAEDIASVEYFLGCDAAVDPIMVLDYDNDLFVVDGVHRLVAAYILGSPIRYRRYTMSKEFAKSLEYPYRRLSNKEWSVRYAFTCVKEYEWKLVNARYKIMNMPEMTAEQLQYGGQSTICELDPSDYESVNWMSDWFNEKCRLSCKRYDEEYPPLKYWEMHKNEIVEACADNLTLRRLSDYVYDKVMGCNNFRPGLMAGAIKYFGAKSVLDFSSGWGDRLIGAVSQGVRYVGVDPNPCVHKGYKEIINLFAQDKSLYTMIQSPFQSCELPDEKFDLVFTSPPYFDLEIYADDSTQSSVEFNMLDNWYDGFLLASIKKALGALNEGGHLVVIINNTRNKPDYVQRMLRDVPAEYLGVISYAERHTGKNGPYYKSPQPMWIWRKSGALSTAKAGGISGESVELKDNIADFPAQSNISDVTLEKLGYAHVDGLLLVSEPEVMKNVANGEVWSREKIINLIKYAEADERLPEQQKYFHYVVKVGGDLAGYVGLYPLEPKSDQLQLRIFLGSKYQGRGYGKASLRLLIDEYFIRGSTLYMQMRPDNIASVRLAESLGFVEVPGAFSVGSTPLRRFILTK